MTESMKIIGYRPTNSPTYTVSNRPQSFFSRLCLVVLKRVSFFFSPTANWHVVKSWFSSNERISQKQRSFELKSPIRAVDHKDGIAEIIEIFGHMPRELLEDILLRVPPKSLQICKRVCKLWYAIITDQTFINKHLIFGSNNKHSSSITLCVSWTCQDVPRWKKEVLSLITIQDMNESNGDHLPCVVEDIDFPPVPLEDRKDFPVTLAGSHCNGISIFYDRFNELIVLCNLELGEFKLLRIPYLSSFFFVAAGFGYDPKTGDHKCFKVLCSYSGSGKHRAFVYTLGTAFWREVEIDLNCTALDIFGVYCKGVYYWSNMAVLGSERMVVSFDLSKEEFQKIQLPEDAQDPGTKIRGLLLWKESVVFFIATGNSWRSMLFEMWMMVDNFDGVEGFTYWTKCLTIGPLMGIHYPLTFWKDDELLMKTTDDRLVSYNLDSKKFRKLPMHGMRAKLLCQAYLYSRSLVSIKRRKNGDARANHA